MLSYGGVLTRYRYHTECKSGDGHGRSSGKQRVGLLQRLCLLAVDSVSIGKEAIRLEEVHAGLIADAEEVYTAYAPEDAQEVVGRALGQLRAVLDLRTLAQHAGITRRQLREIMASLEEVLTRRGSCRLLQKKQDILKQRVAEE